MADSDSFVQEVTEEVRRDAMFAAWKKYGPFVVGALALVIVGTAGRAWWLNKQTAEVRERGGAFIAAQAVEGSEKSGETFLSLASEAEGNYAALASMRAAAAFGTAGDVDRAVEHYDRVAAMSDVDPRLTELAKLRSVMIRADTMDPKAMLDALQPLTPIGSPWRAMALEFEAAAHLRNDDPDAAKTSLQTLIDDGNAPPATLSRIREMMAALGGSPADAAPEPEAASGADQETTEGEAQ